MGKLGRPLGRDNIATINRQCSEQKSTYLYLVQRVGNQFSAYCGTILQVSYTLPKNEKHLVPDYYDERQILKMVGFWIKISGIKTLKADRFNKLYIASSRMPVQETLKHSMAALFVVRQDTEKA